MSGINSLIDTLMHSVLGKRVDIPPQKDLTEPVRPVSPSDAPLAVRSDSRLESGQVAVRHSTGHAAPQSNSPPLPVDAASPSSIQANLSPAARAIAEVLARFPSPPSVLQTQAPLVAPGEGVSTAELATRLQSSIGQSGLFYEHHLDRWYRGDMTLQQLSREPQMMWQRTMMAAPGPAGSPPGSLAGSVARGVLGSVPGSVPGQGSPTVATATGGNAAVPQPGAATAPPPAGQPPLIATPAAVTASSVVEGQRGGAGSSEWQRTPAAPTELPESLQAIVRHQLELLTVPVLRWEGDVWTGVFLALLIQPPQHEGQNPPGDSDEDQDQQQGKPWRSELELEVQGMGHLTLSVHLLGDQLDLQISARSEDVLQRLRNATPALKKGLGTCGFSAPTIRFVLAEAAAGKTDIAGARHSDGEAGE